MFWRKILIISVVTGINNSYAAYDASDVVKAYIGTSVRYDSNLYRRADSAPAVAGAPANADTIIEARAGVKIDKAVSLQQFSLDLNVSAPRYAESDFIDYTGWKNTLAWNWAIGKRLNGVIRYQDIKALSAFDDVLAFPDNCPRIEAGHNVATGYIVDVFRDRRAFVEAGWLIGHQLRIGASLSHIDNSHDQRSCLNQVQTGKVLSLTHISDAGFESSLFYADTDIRFKEDMQVGFFIIPASQRDYEQREYGVAGKWKVSPRTELNLRVGRSGLRFASGGQGPEQSTGSASLLWRYSPKTTLTAGYDRLLESGTDRSGRNLVGDFRLRADWAVTTRTSLYAEGHHIRRDYDSAASQPDPALAERRDKDFTLATGVNWQPVPALTLTTYVNFLRRDANVAQADYDATVVGMSGQWWF